MLLLNALTLRHIVLFILFRQTQDTWVFFLRVAVSLIQAFFIHYFLGLAILG